VYHGGKISKAAAITVPLWQGAGAGNTAQPLYNGSIRHHWKAFHENLRGGIRQIRDCQKSDLSKKREKHA
jgi:hypothetical protein